MTDEDHLRISEAVRAAEAGTAGEIVTIVAERSDRYLDVALWWSLAAVIAMLAALAAFSNDVLVLIAAFSGGWSGDWALVHAFELSLAVATVTFAVVRLALVWVPLRLLLTPGTVKHLRVRRRAVRYFKVGAERRTAGRTGILIYLSMAEHCAEIVADEAIHGKVAPEMWGEAMAHLIAEVKEGQVAEGMAAAIADVGVILTAHFPRGQSDVNELPDRLIEL